MVKIPGQEKWDWLKVRVQDMDGDIPESTSIYSIEEGQVRVDISEIHEGHHLIVFHATIDKNRDLPCRGDLYQEVRINVAHGLIDIEGVRRRGDAPLLLVNRVVTNCRSTP